MIRSSRIYKSLFNNARQTDTPTTQTEHQCQKTL